MRRNLVGDLLAYGRYDLTFFHLANSNEQEQEEEEEELKEFGGLYRY
jgi:hypothetical protein